MERCLCQAHSEDSCKCQPRHSELRVCHSDNTADRRWQSRVRLTSVCSHFSSAVGTSTFSASDVPANGGRDNASQQSSQTANIMEEFLMKELMKALLSSAAPAANEKTHLGRTAEKAVQFLTEPWQIHTFAPSPAVRQKIYPQMK